MIGRRIIELIALAGLLTVLAAQGMAQSTAAPTPVSAPPPPLSPVILTENADVVQRFSVVNNDEVRQMVNSSLLKLTSAQDIGTAWTRLGITSQDIVGIKITTMGGQILSTHHAIVQAICDGLQAAGVPPSQIIIWDKDAADMRSAGYIETAPSDSHVGIAAIFPGTGYDPEIVYKNEAVGTLIWGDSDFVRRDDDLTQAVQDAVKNKAYSDDGTATSASTTPDDPLSGTASIPQTSSNSHFARMVSKICTKIINVPVLCDNSYIGIQGCMGSLALASVDNNRRFQGDPTYGDPAISEILSNDVLRRKVVVHIMDSLIAQYAGGPRFDPQFTRSIGAIYVSRDPVAIDTLALKRLETWRASDKNGRIDPIGKTASHVHGAVSYNLGTDDPGRIQLIRLP